MRRIALYLHGSSIDTSSLAFAIRFADKLTARLSVIHLKRANEGASTDFREMCRGLPLVSYSETERDSVDVITENGFVHDMTIVERLTEQEGSQVMDFNTAVFGTGGPVMITPPKTAATVGDTVALVWGASIPSARAIHSAIPLLRVAKRNVILSSEANPNADPSALAGYLDCYGIKCDAMTFKTSSLTARGRGRALLETVRNLGADLLVMGAYGENKITTMLGLGRTTEKVITSCNIPLLVQA
jgi:nucleotide-binding universal stress UspA family protein